MISIGLPLVVGAGEADDGDGAAALDGLLDTELGEVRRLVFC